jgi:hypothetical protein
MHTKGLISVRIVDCDEPVGGILQPDTVHRLFEAERTIANARHSAAVLLRKARKRRAEVASECESLISAAQLRAIEIVEEIVENARKNVIKEAVTWLIDETQLEEQVAMRVEMKLRMAVAHAVEQWACTASMAEAVAGAVSSAISEQRLSGFTVRVPQNSLEEVKAALADCVACTVKVDSLLTSGEAEIDSEFVHISFNLASELETIIQAIRGSKELTRC